MFAGVLVVFSATPDYKGDAEWFGRGELEMVKPAGPLTFSQRAALHEFAQQRKAEAAEAYGRVKEF